MKSEERPEENGNSSGTDVSQNAKPGDSGAQAPGENNVQNNNVTDNGSELKPEPASQPQPQPQAEEPGSPAPEAEAAAPAAGSTPEAPAEDGSAEAEPGDAPEAGTAADSQPDAEGKEPNGSDSSSPSKKGKGKILVRVLVVLAAVIAVLAVAAVLLWNRWFVKPNLPPTPTPRPQVTENPNTPPPSTATSAPAPSDPLNTEDPEPSETPPEELDAVQPKVSGERKSEEFYTVLLFGEDIASGNTDTMMVISYDAVNQKAAVISLPRDTLRNSSSYYSKKLNNVYAYYGKGERGVEALRSEVSELVGFYPDFYVKVDWELVGEMVDAIGGVWYDVPYRMKYDDPTQNLHIDQETGYRLIDGDSAMQIVRWRHNNPGVPSGEHSGSDIGRIKVQHSFLKAVFEQALQIQNVWKIDQFVELFNSRVTSDLSLENMLWFAQRALLGGMTGDSVEFLVMPYSYGTDFKGKSYVLPSPNKLLTMINEKLNPFVDKVTLSELDLMSINPDGTHKSSTGHLADPDMGHLPVVETPEPTPDPSADPSGDPAVDPSADPSADPGADPSADPGAGPSAEPSQDPDASAGPNPTESGAPVESLPPVESQAPVDPLEPSQQPVETAAPTENPVLPTADVTPTEEPAPPPADVTTPAPTEAPVTTEPPAPAETPAPVAPPPAEEPAPEAPPAEVAPPQEPVQEEPAQPQEPVQDVSEPAAEGTV